MQYRREDQADYADEDEDPNNKVERPGRIAALRRLNN
jgi:hypothetical protein